VQKNATNNLYKPTLFAYIAKKVYFCIMKQFLKFWPSVLVTAFVGLLLLVQMPKNVSMPHIINGDKYVHAFLFMILSMVIYLDAKRAELSNTPKYLISAIWPMIWGGALELLQQYTTTYRTGSWWDWVADLIGIAMAVALARVWQKPC